MTARRPILGVGIALAILSTLSSKPSSTSLREVDLCRVIDGDTVVVHPSGPGDPHETGRPSSPITVRLYGIDAPESDQPGGTEATSFVTNWTDRHDLLLSVHGTDWYGRIIGELSVIGDPSRRTLNEELVYRGLAWWYRDYAMDDEELAALEGRAQAAKRGLWARESPVPPWEWRRGRRTSDAAAGGRYRMNERKRERWESNPHLQLGRLG